MKRRLSFGPALQCCLESCCLLLVLMHLASAQDLEVVFSGNSSRVVGHGVFSRQCSYTGSGSVTRLDWLQGGSQVSGRAGVTELLLTINDPRANQGGEYRCRATFSNDTTVEASGGFLNLYPEQSINAPPIQLVVANNDIDLQCSSEISGTSVSWRDPQDVSFLGLVMEASVQDQGDYSCVIVETTTGGTPIYTAMIQLKVIVPPMIVTASSVNDQYVNELVTFTVSFQSSFRNETFVTWLLDNEHLEDDSIVNTHYTDENAGTTSVQFSPLTRADSGTYTVTVRNTMTILPEDLRVASHSFNIVVFVPPARPSTPDVDSFNNNTRSRITWNLTEHTVDATPALITVIIDDHPRSPVRLPPEARQLVIDTEPGDSYVVTVTASNVDGQTTSSPFHLILPPEAPRIESLSPNRLNNTAFNFTLDVLYTGAGAGTGLRLVNIMFREVGSDLWIEHETDVQLSASPHSRRIWYAVVSNQQFAMIEDVDFSVVAQNIVNQGITLTAQQIIVVPGPPEDIRALVTSANSLTLQAQLSTIGTAPIISAHFVVSGPDGTTSRYNTTKDLTPGGLVRIEAGALLPKTSYSVLVYAINAAGRGQSSMLVTFSTSPADSVLPLWIILVIAIVGTLVVVILLLLLLISCCCRRHNNNKKINITSGAHDYQKEYDRPGPLGAEDCADSVHTNSNYYYNQKAMHGFVLDPPPATGPGSYYPPRSPTEISNVAMSTPYSIVKPQLQNSISESETSDQFNHFNFRHSPVPPPSGLHFDKYSRSMPILDDPDLSPTMPPNCATDV